MDNHTNTTGSTTQASPPNPTVSINSPNPTPTGPTAQTTNNGLSYNTKQNIVILLLIFAYLFGVLLMWLWMKWPIWLKILLTSLIVLLPLISIVIFMMMFNPSEQLSRANDTKRMSDLTQILTAVNRYSIKNNGKLPAGITSTPQVISTTGADICSDLVPDYTEALPIDSFDLNSEGITDCESSYDTGYTIHTGTPSWKVIITAPNAEGDQPIQVSL